MKLLLVIIIILCFMMIGLGLSKYYFSRKRFFENFSIMVKSLQSNIQFNQEKIKSLINTNLQTCKCENVKILCNNYVNSLSELKSDLFSNINILKQEEKNVIENFFSALGKFDASTQVQSIGNYVTKFEEYYGISKAECSKYASMFIKLSIIAGALVCLLII